MVATTGLSLAAGRFGLFPTARRGALEPGLKLSDRGAAGSAGVATGDPAGFTIVDVIALGAFGHALGVGIVLGLRGVGKL